MAKRPQIPFEAIASAALSSIETLLGLWLPDGRSQGGEFKARNPLRSDNSAGSFSVNVRSGKWSDFATDDKGHDLIGLYAYLNGLKMSEAAIEVADQIGFNLPEGCRPSDKPVTERKPPVIDPSTVKPKQEEVNDWVPQYPICLPDNAPIPPAAHVKRGIPDKIYPYYDAQKRVIGYVYRFITSDGGKETLPLTWCHNSKTAAFEWRWMQWTAPNRPLYGLDRLAEKPDAYVLLVSGEKCADVALELLPRAAIVTWSGGDNAVDKIDWQPLAGRKIYAWADCDAQREKLSKAEAEQGLDAASKPLLAEHEQSGIKAMLKIRDKLLALDPSTQFLMASLPTPSTVPSGWDIADAVDAGWDTKRLRDFILNVRDYAPVNQPDVKKQKSAQPATAENTDWRDKLLLTKGSVADTRENVFLMLTNHPALIGLLAYDKFGLKIVKRHPAPWDAPFEGDCEWGDNDSLEMAYWVSQNEKISIRSMDNINHAVKLAASRNAYDPLIEYLDGLQWDGVKRVDYWLCDFVGVEPTAYSSLAGRLFLISMIARAYRPGCLMRAMPVFEGMQFRGKSSVARILGGRWFSDSPLDLKGKDGFINIQGTWLHEIAELGSFSNQEAPVIKAYLSSASDRFRSPFDKFAKDYPRRTVFFGTTNEDVYLRDKTGNSRFWPFKTEVVGEIQLDALAQIRDQLFAEAVTLFNAGERWHPLAEEQLALFAPEQHLRQYDDPWREAVSEYCYSGVFHSTSVSDVLRDCLKVETSKQTSAMGVSVGKILTSLGWSKKRPSAKEGEKRKEFYYRPDNQPVKIDEGQADDIPF